MVRNPKQINIALFSWNTDNLNQIIRSGQVDFGGGLLFREESSKMTIKLILLERFVFARYI